MIIFIIIAIVVLAIIAIFWVKASTSYSKLKAREIAKGVKEGLKDEEK